MYSTNLYFTYTLKKFAVFLLLYTLFAQGFSGKYFTTEADFQQYR